MEDSGVYDEEDLGRGRSECYGALRSWASTAVGWSSGSDERRCSECESRGEMDPAFAGLDRLVLTFYEMRSAARRCCFSHAYPRGGMSDGLRHRERGRDRGFSDVGTS